MSEEITKAPVYLTHEVLTEQEVTVLENRMRKFQSVGYNPDPVIVRKLFNTIRQLRGQVAELQRQVAEGPPPERVIVKRTYTRKGRMVTERRPKGGITT